MKARTKRIAIDLPVWMAGRIELIASHRGVTPQDIVKIWLADRLDTANSRP